MISERYTRTAKIGYTVISILLGSLGLVLMLRPDLSVLLAARICGGIFAVFGIFRLIGYFSRDLFRLAFQYDLAFGILLLSLGAWMLFRPVSAVHFLCAVIGIYILADGLMKIQIAMDAKYFGLRPWYWIFAAAVPACAAGLLLLLRPSDGARLMTVLLGASLLLEGLLNLLTVHLTVKSRKPIHYQQPVDTQLN